MKISRTKRLDTEPQVRLTYLCNSQLKNFPLLQTKPSFYVKRTTEKIRPAVKFGCEIWFAEQWNLCHTIARNVADGGIHEEICCAQYAEVGRDSTAAILRAPNLGWIHDAIQPSRAILHRVSGPSVSQSVGRSVIQSINQSINPNNRAIELWAT